jgi:signal transduction histidine kinase
MSSLHRALAALALVGVLVGVGAIALTYSSDHVEQPGLTVAIGLLVTWSWIGTGIYAWWRRPAHRLGALMVAVGFTYFAGALTVSDSPAVFTLGAALSSLYLAVFAHMLLAYPEGRLEGRAEVRLAAAAYTLSLLGPLPFLMFGDTDMFGEPAPDSVLHVADAETLVDVMDAVTTAAAIVLIAILLGLLARRWHGRSVTQRQAFAPVLWSGTALLVLFAGAMTSQTLGVSEQVTETLGALGLVFFASVPFAFLFGVLRTRVARAGAVYDVLMRLGETPSTGNLRDLLADALGDRTLQLVFWLDDREGWVDATGCPAELPRERDPARAATLVELEGRRVGALVHDVSLGEEPELLRSLATAAGFAMENERLQADLRARVEELRRSRARLVEAGTLERRRLERNLHDGAQQRLVALSLTMRLARAKLDKDPEKSKALLDGATDELELALAELRELARGIHPAVLSDRGLPAALEALAGRSPVPVELAEVPPDRLPEPIEAAAYFVVSEALTNVAKYASASQATVRVQRQNGSAVVEVSDDGIGGADPDRGSGLRGLADRVAALDGNMRLDSPPGAGTRLRAEIPV